MQLEDKAYLCFFLSNPAGLGGGIPCVLTKGFPDWVKDSVNTSAMNKMCCVALRICVVINKWQCSAEQILTAKGVPAHFARGAYPCSDLLHAVQ